jgi:hypothetical protein
MEQQHVQVTVPTVQVTVRQQGGQELQELFEAPVLSSFVDHKLEQLYGPGALRLEGSNVLLAATRALQPAERYIYIVSAGVCGPLLALGCRISVLQTPLQPTVHSGSLVLQHVQHHQLCDWLRVPSPDVPKGADLCMHVTAHAPLCTAAVMRLLCEAPALHPSTLVAAAAAPCPCALTAFPLWWCLLGAHSRRSNSR